MSPVANALPRSVAGHRRRGPIVVAAMAIALVAGGVGGYVLSQHRNGVHALTGTAHVLDHQMSVEVGGWTYGFEETVPLWIDAAGTTHDRGWPNCLRPIGAKVRVRFGEVPVTSPTGFGAREIVWVDCRG